MIRVRKGGERGRTKIDWLDSWHTFSFGEYYDPDNTSFRSLRVMNEDWVAAGQGFGMHGHRDMEIITVVLSGALQHRDSLGNGSVLRPNDLQYMCAGTGIRHSEFNPSPETPVHLYQIWIMPRETGLSPRYAERSFAEEGRTGKWQLVASHDGQDESLAIHQDARVLRTKLLPGQELDFELAAGRAAWLQVMAESATLNDVSLSSGDGAAVEDESRLLVKSTTGAELLLFDLP